ncbi:MAG: hypothetical protein KDE09_19075 [Anaerolineales bacterium]|nr:hypothetical protein [Anaerolineales bacterium]
MSDPTFFWLIWLPLLAAPLVYLVGRLLPEWLCRWLALAVCLLAWVALGLTWAGWTGASGPQFALGEVTLRLDGVTLLLALVSLSLTTLVILYSPATLAGLPGQEKYYALLLALCGSMIGLSSATDLFNLWLWFEATALASYLLVAFYRQQPASLEAGLKYLVQGVAGSVLVLFGVAVVLAATGSLVLAEIRVAASSTPVMLAAAALFVTGFGVKIAIVPLHTWLPDAHSQAPSGISAMLSGAVIEAGLVALLRVVAALAGVTASWGLLLLGLGAINMLVGNLLALPQTQLKRLLAFSSISHVGVMLTGIGTAVYSGELLGMQGALFHLLTHGLMKGLAFLIAGALLYGLHQAQDEHAPLTIEEMSGAGWRYPLAGLALAVALLSLGGVPPLAGFMSKWQVLLAGLATGRSLLIGAALFTAFNSLLSLAYYIPLLGIVYRREPSAAVQAARPLPATMQLPIAILMLTIVLVGLWPDLFSGLTQDAGLALLALGS